MGRKPSPMLLRNKSADCTPHLAIARLSRYVEGSVPERRRQSRSDAEHAGINSNESTITKWNVGSLTVKWSDPDAFANSSPAVVKDSPDFGPFRLYVGTANNEVRAYDASGSSC